jgi:hypothetical protein
MSQLEGLKKELGKSQVESCWLPSATLIDSQMTLTDLLLLDREKMFAINDPRRA